MRRSRAAAARGPAGPTSRLRRILLVEGEQFLGGDQNRTLNVSVLVPAAAALKIVHASVSSA